MKKILSILISLIILLFLHPTAYASVTPVPLSVDIARSTQTTIVITYHITNTQINDKHTRARSESGRFSVGGKTLGTVDKKLTAKLSDNGNGLFSGLIKEKLPIPASVIKKAEQLKSVRIKYKRQFRLSGGAVASYNLSCIVNIKVTSAGGADLSIKHFQLYFSNNRAVISVKKRQPALKAYVDINYNGSGLFQGYWQVDGRILSHVNRYLVYGRTLKVDTPDVPGLPTFSEGPHIVTFIINKPEHDIIQPKAVYYVHPAIYTKKANIVLIAPVDKKAIDLRNDGFRWESEENITSYLIEFIDDEVEKPVFSAFTKKTEYILPPPVRTYYFSKKNTYFWRVKGFGAGDNIMGESMIFKFKIKK